MSVFEL